jgi:plasmid maintenance system antidote protein VapI
MRLYNIYASFQSSTSITLAASLCRARVIEFDSARMPGSFDFLLALPLAGAQTAPSFVAASRITDAAALDVTRTTLSELVNEKRGISAEMAVRLSQVFGGSAESWLVKLGTARPCSSLQRAHKTQATGIRLAIARRVYDLI